MWTADFEDATSPVWENIVRGQLNLLDAVDRRIDVTTPEGREYRLGERLATIMVRPRAWHMDEAHLTVDGRPGSSSGSGYGTACSPARPCSRSPRASHRSGS